MRRREWRIISSTGTRIYDIYLKYIAPEDIHVYSIDEVFIDATNYLNTRKFSARELATKMILDVLNTIGVTATAGIGTNLYLSKIAMDIQAKHIPADNNGMRIAELNEMSYRHLLWSHTGHSWTFGVLVKGVNAELRMSIWGCGHFLGLNPSHVPGYSGLGCFKVMIKPFRPQHQF